MSTDTALIEKREELKRRLAAGEYKTLVDLFLEWFDRLIRKITRRSQPHPVWLIIIILYLAYYSITYLMSYYIQGGYALAIMRGLGVSAGMGDRFVFFSVPAFFIISMVVLNQYIHRIFNLRRDKMLDATESIASLEEFEDWLEKARNWRLHLLVTVGGAILGGLYQTAVEIQLRGVFMGYSFALGLMLLFLYFYAFVYSLLIAVILSARLRRYDLKLFATDPSNCELISHLSGVLGSIVYFVAVFAAYTTLSSALIGLLLPLGIIAVLALWLPIIAMFILNQTSLSSIIRRVKWKTISEVQGKIERLRASKSFGSPDTMDAISKLMDYHDRVKATRNSAINSDVILGFINSLLLPLLALVLGNIDIIIALFK